MIVWIIGLSGSGKSTIARPLCAALRGAWQKPVMYLDGDELRDLWGDNLGHTVEARRENARRISHFCALLDRNGISAVAAVLSIFPEWQEWNRRTFSAYYEVFLDVPIEVVTARDPRGLYRMAKTGDIHDVVGIDIPFPRPSNPDLVVDNSADLDDVRPLVSQIAERVTQRHGLSRE